nr:RecName: Full=Pyruvate dehydrogenase E1 component subunit beta, mitochondrial; Short=PDHE1-B [Solanum tuberosum]
ISAVKEMTVRDALNSA